MKTRNLFLSLFAFAAICACNKEAQPEVPQILEDDACISVRIVTNDADTKAVSDGGFLVSTTENEVKNVLFAFFAADGTFMYTKTINDWTWNTTADGDKDNTPHVEKYSNATVVLESKTIAPRKMVAILNYTNNILTAVNGVSNLAGMYSILETATFSWTEDAKTYFVMTNSSYWDADKSINAFAAQIDEDDIYKKDNEPSGTDHVVDVYVERIAAKLKAQTSNTLITTVKPLDLSNGETIKYYPKIIGYAFTGLETSSYLCKNIEGFNTNFSSNWPGWNDPANKRSYWATSCNNTLTYVDYDDVNNLVNYEIYCHENTAASKKTKLMVKATIMKCANGEVIDDVNDTKLDVVKVGATYYVKDDLEAAIVEELNNSGVKISDAAVTVGNLKYDPAVDHDGYKSKISLEGTITAEDSKAQAIMNKYSDVLVWDDGAAYFSTAVEHLGNALTGTDYGVVRNHIYDLTVSKISGLGTPYVPGIGGDTGDPVIPEEVTYELKAKINILQWKVVSQDVSFGDE